MRLSDREIYLPQFFYPRIHTSHAISPEIERHIREPKFSQLMVNLFCHIILKYSFHRVRFQLNPGHITMNADA